MVKNVTGYDLCKLLAGSWGTLAVMTEVTLKVMPRPESERTLMLRRARRRRPRTAAMTRSPGIAVRRVGRGASAELGVPAAAARSAGLGAGAGGDHAAAARRRCAVGRASQRDALGEDAGAVRRGGDARRTIASLRLWRAVRDVRAVRRWRRARRLAGVADRLSAGLGRRARPGAGARYRRRRDLRLGRRPDLGGAAAQAGRAGARWCASASRPAGGHATLIRGAGDVARAGSTCSSRSRAALAALERTRARQSFDPEGHSQSAAGCAPGISAS